MDLVIYNNKSSYSTVLDALLRYVKDDFDNVVVYLPKKGGASYPYPNVKTVHPSFPHYAIALLRSVAQLFEADSRRDFARAKACGKMNARYISIYLKMLLKANGLYLSSRAALKANSPANPIALVSTWYAENAVALAFAKREFPNMPAVSYAHSYEVDFRKNDYVGMMRDGFKESHIDRICFISRNVMREYEGLNADVLAHPEKHVPIHFGCEKKAEGTSRASTDGVFRLVTCSGISEVKRLDLIISALAEYGGERSIHWIHLGDGPIGGRVRKRADSLNEMECVEASFLGELPNEKIHEFYANNPVDLFMNVSSSEGLPVSIMEAMAYGIPALATDVGGNSEIVNEETGYLLGSDPSPLEILDAICRAMSSAKDHERKRAAAHEMWLREYRIAPNVAKLVRIVKGL